MPGIFGVIDRDHGSNARASERLEIARRMAAALKYEVDYAVDIVSSTALGACAGRVGWPCRSADGQITPSSGAISLLTTGEVVAGGGAKPTVDESYAIGDGASGLARELQRHGLSALADTEGPFAGFLMDQLRAECVLFNDRYGMERLFLYSEQSRVYFASELKAILAVVPPALSLDLVGLSQWLSCGCTVGSRSMFKDLEILEGGSALVFRRGAEVLRTSYFDRVRLEELPALPESQFADEFASSLAAAAGAAIERSPRAGLSLTGGLDSRLVLAALDAPPQTVPCYTFSSMYRLTMDAAVAGSVAAACGQPHQVLRLDRGFLTDINANVERAVYASDGYMGLAGGAELHLNRLAKHVAPARVTGNWGGELLRGVRAFKFRAPKGNFLRESIQQFLPAVAENFSNSVDDHPLSYVLFHQLPHQGFGRYAVERSQVRMRSPFLANRVVDVLYRSSAATRGSMAVVLNVLAQRPALIGIPTDIGSLGSGPTAVQRLRKLYRRLMVKAEYMTSHGAPDWMAAVSTRMPILETAFLGRDKFQHFRHWMRNELSGFVRDSLRADDTSPWLDHFDMRRVAIMVEEHIAGRANYTDEIDKVLTVATFGRLIRNADSLTPSNQPFKVQEMSLPTAAPV